jgi:ribosomal protein S18 acetylase RimI-like enzyme
MQRSAGQVAQTDPEGLIYLWVLLSNTNAISVYEHLGGRRGRTEIQHFAAGNNTPAVMMQWTVREMAELT